MSMFIQHGYGKADRIRKVSTQDSVRGVILSPADESTVGLISTVRDCAAQGLVTMLDPQSYIYSSDAGAVGRRHEENGIKFSELKWSQSPARTVEMVQKIGQLNEQIGLSETRIAPSPLQSSFADVWTPLAIQLARVAADEWGADKTIATVSVEESAFSDRSQVDAWLDVATTLDVKGFYLLVQRSNTSYPPMPWSADTLANLMSMIFVLSELNGYEVHWGYSDSEGLLGLAAGGTSLAAGWSHGLRQFSTSKWVPRKGGSQPAMRYPMRSIMAVPVASAEASRLFNTRLRDDLFDPDEIAYRSTAGFEGITLGEYHVSYLSWLSELVTEVGLPTVQSRLDHMSAALASAERLLSRPELSKAVALPPSYLGRLKNQRIAIERFRDREGV